MRHQARAELVQADRSTRSRTRSRTSRNFPSLFLGLVNEDDSIEFTDGALRLIDAEGNDS